MQNIPTQDLPVEGHNTACRAIKYLFALAALTAVFQNSPGFLIVLAIAAVLILALAERTGKFRGDASPYPRARTGNLSCDGGCFPGAEPEKTHQSSGGASVLDGGSL